MLLTYAAFWKHDLVVTIGQSTGVFIYVRNLMLLRRERTLVAQAAEGAQSSGSP